MPRLGAQRQEMTIKSLVYINLTFVKSTKPSPRMVRNWYSSRKGTALIFYTRRVQETERYEGNLR